MLKKAMSKSEIEVELQGRGDFVVIDYLTKYIEQVPPLDMKKFAYLKLVEVYERRHMLAEAAKAYSNIANLSITFSDKIKYYLKEIEMHAKAGEFERADESLRLALNNANASQKAEIFFEVKDFYKRQAEVYEKERRRGHAVKMYEKLASMNLIESEKEEIKEKLLALYEQLGRIREYMMLKGKF